MELDQTRWRKRRIALLAVCLCLFGLFFIPQVRFLFFGLPEDRLDGRVISTATNANRNQESAGRDRVERALLDAGLSPQPLLGDIGIEGHLTRLDEGTVTAVQLLDYAEGLRSLALRTLQTGRQIPSAFWDVENEAMLADGWDPYRVVAALSSPDGLPYLDALGAAYTRFHAFKSRDSDASDTALDTALDLFMPVSTLIDTVPRDHRLETSEYIRNDEQAKLYFWQQIVVGSSRQNPVTHIPIFDHGFIRRFHVGTIWQYDIGLSQPNSNIWGVSGFAPRFVGPAENNNQVEHMSISMTVQGILREPLLVLDAFEEFERIAGKANPTEAQADEALNQAVREHFVRSFEQDLPASIESLRRALKAR